MHLRYSTKLTMVTVVAAMFFSFMLLSLTMTDYLTRAWLTYPRLVASALKRSIRATYSPA